ncbi:MAG TPA: calcium/sodium antiporter, partial [Micromonosporaceae bacterium]
PRPVPPSSGPGSHLMGGPPAVESGTGWVLLLIVVGLVVLAVGAELVVHGASRLAGRLGVSPMIIGLTVVSITTSTPELAVGIGAARVGAGDIAVGNIAGTNAVNLLLILGLSALIRPLRLHARTLRGDLPLMAAAAAALLLAAVDGLISRLDGALLLAVAVVYTAVNIRASRRERARVRAEYEAEDSPPDRRPSPASTALDLLGLLAGVAVVTVGAEWLVTGAVEFAERRGVSDAVIGLTIVAIGTSAPEIATMISATVHDRRDVAVGNLIGSSVYNLTLILPMVALVIPLPVTEELVRVDLPVMAAATLACVPVFMGDRRVTRLEGGLFVLAYAGYLAYLLVART